MASCSHGMISAAVRTFSSAVPAVPEPAHRNVDLAVVDPLEFFFEQFLYMNGRS